MVNWLPWPWLEVIVFLVFVVQIERADPQINLINQGCSQYEISRNFFNDLNATFPDLRKNLLDDRKHFATVKVLTSETMVQCRNYLSTDDCVKCFDAATVQIGYCSLAIGGRVVYDGCFLRYEMYPFSDQTTMPGNGANCGNLTAKDTVTFKLAVGSLMKELERATPKISDHYAAVKTELTGGGHIYGMAQCAETVNENGCQDCLKVASSNIQSCFPYTDARAFDSGCFLRYSTTSFFADNQTINIRPFLEQGRSSSRRKVINGVAAGGAGLLLIAFVLFFWYHFSKTEKASQTGNILGTTLLQGPLRFSYKDLKNATDNFNEENKLGEGGFGKVYKGTLKNGNVVAVKKLIVSSSAGREQFESEVKLISNIHHRNLIRLLGYSSNEAEILLVYEYMKHGSLDRFLYGEKRGTLNWRQRYDIIVGTAKGLASLHEQFHVCIIHRDIKSSNILLDEDFQPKIADFGLARLLPEGHSHLSTKFAGTLGYTAPEYAIYGHLSERVDIYSFGVVILEIISGRRSTDVKSEPVAKFLLEEAWNFYQQDEHLKLVDETLAPEEFTLEELKKVAGIALACIQSPASARPSMSSVVAMLSVDSPVNQQLLGRPTLVNLDWSSAVDIGSLVTHATATFTQNSGR